MLITINEELMIIEVMKTQQAGNNWYEIMGLYEILIIKYCVAGFTAEDMIP